MKKHLIFLLAIVTGFFAAVAQEKQDINSKIENLLKNKVFEITDDELKTFTNKDFEQKVISKIKEIDPTDPTINALCDFIEVGNYEILNAIKLDSNNIFLNYLIRKSESIPPKNPESNQILGRFLIQHHVFFKYDISKKEITEIQYIYTQYSPILFHKYEYNNKSILYGIGNNSSFGMARTDIYILAFSVDSLDLLFSDCILYSQSFYSKEVEDINFEKDFTFNKDTLEITGQDFDFNEGKYIDYKKVYKLF